MHTYDHYYFADDMPTPEQLGLEDSERHQRLIRVLTTSLTAYAYSDDGYVASAIEALREHQTGPNIVVVDLDREPTVVELQEHLGIRDTGEMLQDSEWRERHAKLVVLGLDRHLERVSGGGCINDPIMWLIQVADKTSAGTVLCFHGDYQAVTRTFQATLDENLQANELLLDFTGFIRIE